MESVIEIVRIKQVVKKRKGKHLLVTIKSPEDAANLLRKEIGDEDREVFFVIALNTKGDVIAIHRCHVGSINASIAHPREIMKSLILNNATSFIVGHVHPSGHTFPSNEDLNVTNKLSEVGELLGIELLDHVIVSYNQEFTSLKEKGYL
ncbi:MAG: JAB domain-containing protein [Bacillota bacterium]|nr:JAB domain-containing protein [Bacillota bacterium]